MRLCLFGGKLSCLPCPFTLTCGELTAPLGPNAATLRFFLSFFRCLSASRSLAAGEPAGEEAFPLPFRSLDVCAGDPGSRALSLPKALADLASPEETTTEGGKAFLPKGVPGREGGPLAMLPEPEAAACTACIAGEGLIVLLTEAVGGSPFLAIGAGFSLGINEAVCAVSGFAELSFLKPSLELTSSGGEETATIGTDAFSFPSLRSVCSPASC